MQIAATLVSTFVCTAILNFQIGLKDVCTPDAPFRFTCPGINTFFTAVSLCYPGNLCRPILTLRCHIGRFLGNPWPPQDVRTRRTIHGPARGLSCWLRHSHHLLFRHETVPKTELAPPSPPYSAHRRRYRMGPIQPVLYPTRAALVDPLDGIPQETIPPSLVQVQLHHLGRPLLGYRLVGCLDLLRAAIPRCGVPGMVGQCR